MIQNIYWFFCSLKSSLLNTLRHNGPEYAGYLAFLLLLSIFPFLFFFTAIAGYFGSIISESSYTITRKLASFFTQNVPENIIQGIMPYIEEILEGPTQSLLTFAIFGAVWTASSMIGAIKSMLNKAYNFPEIESFSGYIIDRFVSVLEFLVISFVIFLFFAFPRIIPIIQVHFPIVRYFNNFPYFVNSTLSILLLFFFITFLYMFLPKKKQNFISVVPGSTLVMLLWIISSGMFSFYIKSFAQVSLIYGSIAGVIIVLLFFYIINLCFIYGAELNAYIKNTMR